MKPVIVLAFSNDRDKYLPMITRERKNIFKSLQTHHDSSYVQVHKEENTSLEDLFQLFNRYRDQIVIFHYGGHADGTHLQLENSAGESQTAHAEGLAQLMGQQKQLQLVFLNGCATLKQVDMLLSAGVGAVIATAVPIQDEMATEFAEQFYNSLAGQTAIQEAFETAKAFITAKYGPAKEINRYYHRVLREKIEKTPHVEIPWGLYHDENRPGILEWKLPTSGDPLPVLREGSKKYYEALRGPNGRFKFLRISDIILPGSGGEWLETCAEIDEKSQDLFEKRSRHPQKLLDILEVLPRLWSREIKHAVVVGDGGMGKTVSLIHWWEKLLEPGEHRQGEPVPVFIALNEFNQVPEGERKDFIMASVLRNYGGDDREPPTAAEVRNTMKTPLKVGVDSIPSIVLLLDGFNEITVEKTELLLELNHLAEQCPGLQVVLTSRYDMRGNFNWGYWNLVKLKELEEEKVAEYLHGKGLAVPKQERLRTLLRNPMMLTLYAASCEVQANHKESRYCCFKDTVESPGELLWNFMEAQVDKLPERLGQDEGRVVYYRFLLKYVLPGLGYEMEKQGLFDFTNAQFLECLDRLCRRFGLGDFLTAIPYLGKYVKLLPVGESGNDLDRIERAAGLRDIFCNELHMLVEEGESLRFLHQDFRDFFAAVHVLNEVDISLKKNEIPGVLKERIVDYFVRRLLGEIEGEHRIKSYLVKEVGWKIDINKDSCLYRALELCRFKFSNQEQLSEVFGSAEPFLQKGFCPPEAKGNVGYAVWNIVMIWQEVRGELTGADLSGLDLSGIPLNGVRCSRFYEDDDRDLVYLAAGFDGSRVHEKSVLPQGHTNSVNSVVYSADGKKILSASFDDTIKEWDAGTGECLKTLAGHTNGVFRAVYSRDGKKILSASNDKTIKEWDAGTGECVKTLAGHKESVNLAVYSRDGKKILSASSDNTIKEWDAGTGACVKTLAGHTNVVISAVYSPDGKKILSASGYSTIKEWDAATGKCVKTLAGHTLWVNSAVYSRDGKKILSASDDKTIKEWDAGTGECVKNLAGHTNDVNRAVYSPDGKKILSASDDETIKEWDAGTGECVKTLVGHDYAVTSAVYSADGKKILSASKNKTIKEWDAGTGACVKTLAGHTSIVKRAVYSRDGKKILSASSDNTIKEWDAGTGKCVKTLAGHTSVVNWAVYSPDGGKILSASWDHTIKEWDAGTGQCVKTLAGHKSEIESVVYSPDGEKILSAFSDGTIKEWDAGTGECLKTLAGHMSGVWSAVYSPDGKKILSASRDCTIKEWDAGTGECVKTLTGHKNYIQSAVYSANGKKILSASGDCTIKEWDADTGECVKTLEGYTAPVESAVYSTDGNKIFSDSRDGIIKEWDAATGQCLKTHNRKDNPNILGYPPNDTNIPIGVFYDDNKIYLSDAAGKGNERVLIYIPGLFIQGCSFQNLEKGSQWTEKGLKILKQYNASI